MCMARQVGMTVMASVTWFVPSSSVAAQPTWEVNSTPKLVIESEDAGRSPLGRVVGVRRLPSGDIVVADGSAMELRLFDARGRFVRVAARQGRGPGELTHVSSLSRSRRAVIAIGGMDVVSLSLDGRNSARVALPSTGGPPTGTILAAFDGDRVLLGESRFRILSPPSRVLRDTMRLVIASLTGKEERREIGRYANQTSLLLMMPSAPGGLKFGRLGTAPQLETAVTDKVCWIGDSGGSELVRVDAGTGVIQRIRIPMPARRWQSDVLERFVREVAEAAASPIDEAFTRAWETGEFRSPAMPSFRALHADVRDGVWIEHFVPSLAERPRFLVLSSDGKVVANVVAPRAMRLMDIGEDYIIGAEKDENDVERLAVYALRRR